jgi:ATP-dependent exoDNAse (exonuclease V) alpha subunit
MFSTAPLAGLKDLNDQNNQLYVGMSRAKGKLVVVGDAEIIKQLVAMNSQKLITTLWF